MSKFCTNPFIATGRTALASFFRYLPTSVVGWTDGRSGQGVKRFEHRSNAVYTDVLDQWQGKKFERRIFSVDNAVNGAMVMKKALIWLFLGGFLGGIAGFAAGIFIYPYIFLADIVADERIDNVQGKSVVANGTFIHADPSDPIHYGQGQVTVYDDVVHLGEDFTVGPGPAFHVYLVPEKNVGTDTKVAETMFIDLGRLRAFKGSQVYPIPAGVDLENYGSVVIWCRQFGVLISPAMLKFS